MERRAVARPAPRARQQRAGGVGGGARLAQRGRPRAARAALAAGRHERPARRGRPRRSRSTSGADARRPRRPPRGRAPSASPAGASRRSPTGRSGRARRRRRAPAARRARRRELELDDLERARARVRRGRPISRSTAARTFTQPLQRAAEPAGIVDRPARVAVDEHVDEPPLGRRLVRVLARTGRSRSARSSARGAPTRRPACTTSGNASAALERAVRLGAEADRRAAVDVEPALADQARVDDGVEERSSTRRC